MQTENRNTNIHIKAALNSEFRRFSMDKANFTQLEESIRTLYSLPITSIFNVCFIDDEGDNVLISSDEEFLYAADLVRPIKLIITRVSTPLPVETSLPAEPVQFELCQTEPATYPGHPCRRGRGRRGGPCQRAEKPRCEERKKWREEKLTLTKEERIQHKTIRISERIKHIEAFLLNDLPAHRERALTWKLEKLQSKLEYLQSVLAPIQTPTNFEPTSQTTEPEHVDGRRGCHGRRGGFGQGRKPFENQTTEGCEKKWGRFEHKQRPEGCGKKFGQFEHQAQEGCEKKWGPFDDQVWQCRKNLRAARDAGNQSEIDQCFQALKEAKCQKWNAKREGRPECKRFFQEKHCKRECMKNLREARASGEPEKIQDCEKALTLAREALQKAKVELRC